MMAVLGIIISVIVILILVGHFASRVRWQGWYINWIDGLVRILCRVVHRLRPTTIDLPQQGGALIVANHVSGLDPFLLIAACRRPVRFLIAREEYERPVLHHLFKAAGCIPVDRSGRPEIALRQALKALRNGEVIGLFPQGEIRLDTEPPKKLKAGFTRLAAWADVPIYPVRIDGVGGLGRVVLAPFIPSKVVLTLFSPLQCQTDSMQQCLQQVEALITSPSVTAK